MVAGKKFRELVVYKTRLGSAFEFVVRQEAREAFCRRLRVFFAFLRLGLSFCLLGSLVV